MNSSAQPPRTVGVCGVGLRLLLGLLPCMVVGTPPLTPEPRWPIRSRPYLAVLGPSPLRIQAEVPPPDLSAHPPAGAPPQVVPHTTAESPGELPTPTELSSATATQPASEHPPIAENSPVPNAEEKPAKPAKSILPDDTRPKVRAEDFLPFFQPPGASPNPNDVTLTPTPPAPGVQTPSSATYRQQ